jgi:hypothetical protein
MQVKGKSPVIEEGPGEWGVLVKLDGVYQSSRGPEEVVKHVPGGARYMKRDPHR